MEMKNTQYRSIFTQCTRDERDQNFESYWDFSQKAAGELFEEEKDLARKREKLAYFKDNPVRCREPLADPELFYRNYVKLKDNPAEIDPKILMLTCIYKFARHEWVGISGAWDAIPSMAESKSVTDKISRVHLAEEFCHVRFFDEMLRTFQLDKVEWVPLGPVMERIYRTFPYFPGFLMDTPAFITELMGITFYQHLDALFDTLLVGEPEARDRVKAILREIMVDELAHVGQRRNFIGPIGIKIAKQLVGPMYRMFFMDIPETKHLFDIDQMVKDGSQFDFSEMPKDIIDRSWIPSYCIQAA